MVDWELLKESMAYSADSVLLTAEGGLSVKTSMCVLKLVCLAMGWELNGLFGWF